MANPFQPESYVQETVQATASEWANEGAGHVLQVFQIGLEIDSGAWKQGDGVTAYEDLLYAAPQGQVENLDADSPASTDIVEYVEVTAAVQAEASLSCEDAGTVGANIQVGGKVYTIVASGATGDEIDAGTDGDEYAANIADKVTEDEADTLCTANDSGSNVAFIASEAGAAGNNINLFTTDEVIIDLVGFADGEDASYVHKKSLVSNFGGGTGDVVGPASSTDNAIARFDSTTGKLLQNSTITLGDTGVIAAASGSLTLTTPVLGVATATSINKVAVTAPATSATLTIADGKTLTVSNSIAFAGTDSTTMTFPGASASIGYLNIPQNSQSDDYTLVLADSGKHIYETGASKTVTIPANGSVAFPVGTAVTIIPSNASGCTIAITTDTLIWADGGGTGSRTLAQYGVATAIKVASTTWIISGVGLS